MSSTASTGRDRVHFPPLIPRRLLFGNPVRSQPRISPDGQFLAYLAPDERNVLQVWLQVLGQDGTRQLTADPKRGIRQFFWAYDGQQLIYLQDADGDENFHCYAVNIRTGNVRDLTPFQGVKAQPLKPDPSYPEQLLVGLNLRNRQIFDVYRINLINGAVELDTENPGNAIAWTADEQFQIRSALSATEDGGYNLLLRETVQSDWEVLRHWGPDDQGYAVGFSADSRTLYLAGSHDANTQRLIALDLATREETVVAEDPQYDLDRVLRHPTEKTLQAVSFYRDRAEWQVLDPMLEADFVALKQARPGEFNVVSRTLDDRRWIVAYVTDDGPIYYTDYDRETQTSTLLFSNNPELEDQPLVPMQSIAYTARDGLEIHGYLTLPIGGEAPLPMVLLVHGGPWARNTWGYDPRVQWLANRGYGILQVNYRGSVGYGKAFVNAGNREWAAKMHDDLIDAVDWLVDRGVTARDRIAIMGGSYGGYATLVALTFTPDVFACGVDLVGPSNLVTLLQTIPPYWAPMKAMFATRVGDVETEVDFLKSRSPLFFADRIAKPLLIGQGANDPRVKQAESEQIVAAMQNANKPVIYVVYQDEGHSFARPENRLHFYAIAETFLAEHLGGQFEPMDEIEGHSGIVS